MDKGKTVEQLVEEEEITAMVGQYLVRLLRSPRKPKQRSAKRHASVCTLEQVGLRLLRQHKLEQLEQ